MIVIQRPYFVILSEAKDLPSGIRLRKALRQAQGDKAVLSLGRCFDKLSMTRPALHDMSCHPERPFCHPERRASARSRRILLPAFTPWNTLRQAQGDKAVLSLGRCFDKLSMTRPAQHDKTTTSETKKASVDRWAICPVIVSPTVGIENVSRETFSAPIFCLFPLVSVFCALIGGYKIQEEVRFSAQPLGLRKI